MRPQYPRVAEMSRGVHADRTHSSRSHSSTLASVCRLETIRPDVTGESSRTEDRKEERACSYSSVTAAPPHAPGYVRGNHAGGERGEDC